MGQSVSEIRLQEKEKKQEEQERVEKMVTFLLDKQLERILQGKLNDQEIDTGTIVELQKQVRLCGKEIAKKAEDAIETTVGDFFKGQFIEGTWIDSQV